MTLRSRDQHLTHSTIAPTLPTRHIITGLPCTMGFEPQVLYVLYQGLNIDTFPRNKVLKIKFFTHNLLLYLLFLKRLLLHLRLLFKHILYIYISGMFKTLCRWRTVQRKPTPCSGYGLHIKFNPESAKEVGQDTIQIKDK